MSIESTMYNKLKSSYLLLVLVLSWNQNEISAFMSNNRPINNIHYQCERSHRRVYERESKCFRLTMNNNPKKSLKDSKLFDSDFDKEDVDRTIDNSPNLSIKTRRSFLSNVSSIIAISTLSSTSIILSTQPVNAFEKAYPNELNSVDAIKDSDYRKFKMNQIMKLEKEQAMQNEPITNNKILGSTIWGGALWWLSGSRNNPIATPLANIIYKRDNEKWLQERNDGWFAALPWEFLIILSFVYIIFGYIVDSIIVLITSTSDSNLSIDLPSILTTTTSASIQLACVTLIASGSLELGRIFSGEKTVTKKEADRLIQLEDEFVTFANERLVIGTSSKRNSANVHRNEVVNAFRRYYAKYRRKSNENDNNNNNNKSDEKNDDENNVTDLEIERILRVWASTNNISMSSAGFYNGIKINLDADVFAK